MKRRTPWSPPSGLHATRENGTSLLGGHLFLFAFHAHEFQFALFGFDRRSDFLLDLGCRS